MNFPDRYKPTGEKFDGGMSDAVLCEDQHLQRTVLVKSLKAGINSGRLFDEIEALQAIRSKHVVQIFDVIADSSGTVYGVVQEYVPGDDLTKLPSPTTEGELLRILYSIAEGISDIHAHGITHRDIKRQNMKYDAEGCLKIFDFGLARDEENASTVGEKGTPGYMAPELFDFSGKGVKFTPAVDVFAFGATALAIVHGKVPKGLKATPPTLPCKDADFSSLPIPLPAALAGLLNLCLASKPADRPQIADVVKSLAAHLLRDQHRALLVSGGSTYTLDSTQKVVQLSAANRGEIRIEYDGLQFVVTELSGEITINNMAVAPGFILPGSCVIALGAASLGKNRTFITVDVSHPEVVI